MTTPVPPAVPKRFAHLIEPYVPSDSIVIAETTSLAAPGSRGMRKLTTALVPLNRLKQVVNGGGAQGWLRMEFSDGSIHRKGRVIHGPFDLVTPAGLVVEALVESWTNHNILVSVPQNRLVATYGLQPRVIDSDQSVRWDDPEHITYDVVEVRAFSKYGLPNEYTRSEVLLRRAYAEDYAGLRSRAIVAVYYEEHSIAEDAELEALLGAEEYRRIDIPGIGIEIKRNPVNTEYPLFIAAWGCRLRRSPIAETLSRIAMVPTDSAEQVLVAITDGREESGIATFECGTLPAEKAFHAALHGARALEPASLKGIHVRFAFIGFSDAKRPGCETTLRRELEMQELWKSAFTRASAASIQFDSAAPRIGTEVRP